MDLTVYRDKHLCLTFLESNILLENIKGLSKPALLVRLTDLQEQTEDALLKRAVSSLIWKLSMIGHEDYVRLTTAAASRDLLFPANYPLTSSAKNETE